MFAGRLMLPDESLGMLGDDSHDELARVMDREWRLARRDRRVALDEVHLELGPERRRLGVDDVCLVGLGRQVDLRPELRLALRASRQA